MNLNVIITVMIMAVTSFVSGQSKADAAEMSKYQTEKMEEVLKLDENQVTEITPINLKYSEKAVAVMESDEGMFSKMGSMKKMQHSKEEELEKILTADQMKKYMTDLKPEFRKYFKSQFMK
ncbi:hypothetical protein [Aquimarina sp. 2201CG5-10]|uniref:hypothetical protein n=1 Tax=Aquimarina callyspongiae TaxID=3098150 RepID=UPI002AB46A5A|nr:hypothetical protein [Aquimarina sp. 2201CG5-10]MDY8136137.1 hypothetical protein [Aquimarina sp. 2201CG5-10]